MPLIPFVLALVVGGVIVAAVASSGASPKAPGAILPNVSSVLIAIWESAKVGRSKGAQAIPLDKLSTHGQKFIDPCGIALGTKGYENVMSLPSDAKARMTFIHSRAQSTIPKPVPAADVLISAAGALGISAADRTKQSLIDQRDAWIDRIRSYGRMTANGWVVAFVELWAALIKLMPMEWSSVFQRAKSLAEGAAESIKRSLVTSIAYGAPYPMHILDDEVSSVGDLQSRATRMESNLGQFVTLPDAAKGVISSWFALLAMNTDKDDVQRAIMATDDTEWGKSNLASDDQVYLAATVFAASLNEPTLPFAIELWNRAKGWSRWRGLATNWRLVPPSVFLADNSTIAYDQSTRNGKPVASPLGYWFDSSTDEETGYSWASNCIGNARQLNWLDIILTGWEMVGERTGRKAINDKPIKFAALSPSPDLPPLPAPPTPKG